MPRRDCGERKGAGAVKQVCWPPAGSVVSIYKYMISVVSARRGGSIPIDFENVTRFVLTQPVVIFYCALMCMHSVTVERSNRPQDNLDSIDG